ncbi:MAG: hypothetical protein P8Y94_01500 [Acidobacteriota bacterium]
MNWAKTYSTDRPDSSTVFEQGIRFGDAAADDIGNFDHALLGAADLARELAEREQQAYRLDQHQSCHDENQYRDRSRIVDAHYRAQYHSELRA